MSSVGVSEYAACSCPSFRKKISVVNAFHWSKTSMEEAAKVAAAASTPAPAPASTTTATEMEKQPSTKAEEPATDCEVSRCQFGDPSREPPLSVNQFKCKKFFVLRVNCDLLQYVTFWASRYNHQKGTRTNINFWLCPVTSPKEFKIAFFLTMIFFLIFWLNKTKYHTTKWALFAVLMCESKCQKSKHNQEMSIKTKTFLFYLFIFFAREINGNSKCR